MANPEGSIIITATSISRPFQLPLRGIDGPSSWCFDATKPMGEANHVMVDPLHDNGIVFVAIHDASIHIDNALRAGNVASTHTERGYYKTVWVPRI
jgi:hypothetical protein